MRLLPDLSLAALFASVSANGSFSHLYQRVRPITEKNIGRNRLKSRSRYMPHQGKRECARRLRQWARIEARRAGQ